MTADHVESAPPESAEDPERTMSERLIDDLVPEGVDWERLVRSYPLPSLALAAVGGLLLGRSRGSAVVAALAAFASKQASHSISQVLGEDVLAG